MEGYNKLNRGGHTEMQLLRRDTIAWVLFSEQYMMMYSIWVYIGFRLKIN